MKQFYLALLLSLGLSSGLFAQNPYQIKGIVADTTSSSRLHNATISILNAKDSTLYKFTRAAANGTFSIPTMKKGNFILLLTYPNYVDYVAPFALDSANLSVDFKVISMNSKAQLLNEIIVKGKAAAIKIKGDTTEFNAASYTIQPNDKVEDLLKKLPGIQVDKDGKITAQGKTVPKVLVDGEEFFGDDPTLVTKNLRADMVDKVQLFEKKSDQAAFTGVDDGQNTQTINIKLKEDKKNGYFGKVDAGIGSDGFYQGQAMFNKFKAKQKFSLYGTTSNTNKTGLAWGDSDRFGGGGGDMQFIDGGMMVSFGGGGDEMESWGGQYDGEGIPRANNGGAHYDTKWNKDKESINVNYKIGSLSVKANKNTINQNTLPERMLNTNEDKLTDNYMFRQKVDATYQIKLDTTSNLKIMIDGTLKNNETSSNFNSIATRGDNSLSNKSTRDLSNNGDEQTFNISAFYTKKLKKAGRNYSIKIAQMVNEKDNEGYLKAKNEFFSPIGQLDSIKNTDQFKLNKLRSNSFSSNITYAEPFSKKLSLLLNYGFGLNNSNADKRSYNTSAPGKYDLLDPLFSNDFEATQITNQGGAVFNYKSNKTTLNWGTKINAVSFDQSEAYSNTRYKRSFLNWIPQASYQYRMSQQKSLRLNYYGYTSQPSLTQLQPVRVNDDPLNITLGNTDLKPSYSSSFSISYNSYKVLTNQSIYISGSYGFVNNQIINNTITDDAGKTISQSINLRDKTPVNYNLFVDLGRKINVLDTYFGLNFSMNGSTNYSYINSKLNETNTNNYSASINLSKSKEKKYEIQFYGGPSYRTQNLSLRQNSNNDGWSFRGSGSFAIFFPGKIQLKSDAQYTYNGKTQSLNSSFSQVIWNSSLTKSFFKGENLKMSITGNDLLNQNRGFDRNASENMITQTSYSTIRRYFMYSITWDFNKMGGVSKN
ncbi:outer membrane beta-barrel protein [Pedobacter sp. Hv1]|uniref:outer membrane beta-barrel protein n=1 Tax=Pedobacter sp. Hv1 TaxID=1740090 RepID=UPI0006D8ADF5|nr:outer membrane beta-barrel protein [Pedobacter sp. Hv1]KQB99412.1 TonB-dependent receptor [Pedobacter sp. Hv1]